MAMDIELLKVSHSIRLCICENKCVNRPEMVFKWCLEMVRLHESWKNKFSWCLSTGYSMSKYRVQCLSSGNRISD